MQHVSKNSPVVFLDFDGVLFLTLREVFAICQFLTAKYDDYRDDVSFEEFCSFRRHLTDAWQFNLLYHRKSVFKEFCSLSHFEKNKDDELFARRFFETRADYNSNYDTSDLFEATKFFLNLLPALKSMPEKFAIVSTRNRVSILAVFKSYGLVGIPIFGQEQVQRHGTKFNTLLQNGLIEHPEHVLIVDDMQSHLHPFQNLGVNCIQADWGYDVPGECAFDVQSSTHAVLTFISANQNYKTWDKVKKLAARKL